MMMCDNMNDNFFKNITPKIMIVLIAFVLMFSIPSESTANFVIGGGTGSGGSASDFSAPFFVDNSITIDQNILVEDVQNIPVTAFSGKPVEFIVLASDNTGAENITHLDLFLNHDGDKVLNNLKETYVSFSYDELFIQNPYDIIESATLDTVIIGDNKEFIFNVVFAENFDSSNVLIRSWDLFGNGSTLYLPNSLKVIDAVQNEIISPISDPEVIDTVKDVNEDISDEIILSENPLDELKSVLPFSIMIGNADGTVIPYDITGGMVTAAVINLDDNSIVLSLDAFDDGTLIVSPSKSTQDGIFMVLIDGEQANDVEIDGNDVTVSFPAGTDTIEVIGTFVIPEFGTIAMMILIISIVSVIAISSKSRLSLRV